VKPARAKDGRETIEFSKKEMKEFIRVAGVPWFNRRKRIPRKRIEALRNAGFSIRQIAKIYGTSDSTVRRRIKGK
jgi:DNA invertase Pin-like site-specific DNA recombinase